MFCAEMTMAEFALSMERPQSRQITRLKRTRPLHWSWLIEDRFFFFEEEEEGPAWKVFIMVRIIPLCALVAFSLSLVHGINLDVTSVGESPASLWKPQC
jgi:hypothetical protein